MKVGFTGSRDGMTMAQKTTVQNWIAENCTEIDEVHHGDCVGADDEFDTMVRTYGMAYCVIVSHPSNMENWRANVDNKETAPGKQMLQTVIRKARPPILRNCDIVESCDVVIATPKTYDKANHSGTWFTLSYAEKMRKKTILVLPDGRIA